MSAPTLNPEIVDQPDRADEVIYNLRACILSVQADGLVRANENFMAWLGGEKTMPFGPNGVHVPVRLVDFCRVSRARLRHDRTTESLSFARILPGHIEVFLRNLGLKD